MTVTAWQLLGREEELGAIVELLDAPELLPGVVVLPGDAGIGKTALWLAGCDAASVRGYRVLISRPSEAETRLSFSGLADFLAGAIAEVLPELPPIQRRALEAALLLGESKVDADERAVAAAFLGALRMLARESPLCVAVDDVQWLDAASLAVLRYALARLDDEPVAVLVAVRGDPPEWLRRAAPEGRLRTIEVGGLTVGAMQELLHTRLDATFPRPIVVRLWETSGGNPFFALELASALQRRGGTLALGEDLPIPRDLDELLRRRLEVLSAAALATAQAVAALADPSLPLVEAAVGRGYEAGLRETLAARIVELEGDRLRFTHPLLGSALTTHQTPSRRRSLHARLAEIVPTGEERARHLALATDRPNRVTAAALEEAARIAQLRGAPADAAELAEHASERTPPEDVEDGRRRLLLAADRYLEAGDHGRAEELLARELEGAPPGRARATVLVHLAKARSAVAPPRDVIALYEEALAEGAGDEALEASIHLSVAPLYGVTDKDRGLAHAETGARLTARVGDAALRCRALASYAFMHCSSGRGIPASQIEEALALERSLPEWPLANGAVEAFTFMLVWSGELERARPILHEFREALHFRGDPAEWNPLWLLTILEWRAGNWELASRYAVDAAAVREQAGLEAGWPIAQLPGAIVAAHRGDVETARTTSERALAGAGATGIRISESGHLGVLGFVELSLGDPARALDHLRPAWRIRDEVGLLEPGHRLELSDTLEALVAVGELDEAEALIAPWQDRSRELDRAGALAILARSRGLMLAARGDLERGLACFEDALAQHARTQDPFQHARTLLALGRTQRRAKKRGDARTTLEDARARFDRLGAPLWAEQTRAELARIGGRAPSRGELTEAERRIAQLVAEGGTNREVAAALFLTEHSVETALTRVYRKLGVRSRSELARLLGSNT